MKYLVIEIQKFDTGAVSTPAYAYDDINAAQSKYHAILSAAALSKLPCHAAVLMNKTGYCIWGYGIPDYVAKEKPKEEIKMEVKVQFSALVKSETADKINSLVKKTGKDAGSIIDSLVEKGSM